MHVIIIKWWVIKPFKPIYFCAISLEINQGNVHCFTPVMLQSTAEIACRNFCLFLSLYTRVTKHDTVSSIENEQLIWTIGKWSEMSATKIPFNEQFKSSWLFVNILSISVADVLVILVGREISGRNSLQYKTSTNSLVKSSFSEFSRSIV